MSTLPADLDDTIINTTRLARRFGVTTTQVAQRLTANGIEPVSVATMPTGRSFKAWPKPAAIKALSHYYSDKEAPVIMRPKDDHDKPVDAAVADLEGRFHGLEGDVEQIKQMLTLLVASMGKRNS